MTSRNGSRKKKARKLLDRPLLPLFLEKQSSEQSRELVMYVRRRGECLQSGFHLSLTEHSPNFISFKWQLLVRIIIFIKKVRHVYLNTTESGYHFDGHLYTKATVASCVKGVYTQYLSAHFLIACKLQCFSLITLPRKIQGDLSKCVSGCMYVWCFFFIADKAGLVRRAAAPGGQDPQVSRFTEYQLVCGNVINCRTVWDYAPGKHRISWNDKSLQIAPWFPGNTVLRYCSAEKLQGDGQGWWWVYKVKTRWHPTCAVRVI